MKLPQNFFIKNWLVFVGVLLVLGILWIDLATVQAQKAKVVRECKEFYQEKIKEITKDQGKDFFTEDPPIDQIVFNSSHFLG